MKKSIFTLGLFLTCATSMALPCFAKAKNLYEDDKVYEIRTYDSPSRESNFASVSLVVFTDFQCPACASAAATVNKLIQAYPNEIKYYVKNYPLSFHKYAFTAAVASLAARRQGKYWEMYDILFKNYRSLSKKKILLYAEKIGLDIRQFKRDFEDERLKDQVKADKSEGNKLGVSATPTFFINGRKKRGAPSLGTFKKIIDQELGK